MKRALLAAGFGTTVPHAAQELAALEAALADAAPGWTMARAYTSGMVRRILAERGQPVDSVAEALSRLKAAGVEEVFVQPTHFLCGIEYEKLKADAAAAAPGFARLRVGRPLLDGTEAVRALAALLMELCPAAEGRAVIVMGHGTAAFANLAYPALQTVFELAGRPDLRVGTVEGWPGLEEARSWLRAHPACRSVRLVPLLLAAGDHALHDMAGEDPGSWQSILEKDGCEVSCTLRGLAAEPAFRQFCAARMAGEMRQTDGL